MGFFVCYLYMPLNFPTIGGKKMFVTISTSCINIEFFDTDNYQEPSNFHDILILFQHLKTKINFYL